MADCQADVATAVTLGRRERQEDAVLADFCHGAEAGFAVLSDGMGGHDDGDLASAIIVSQIFGALSVSGRRGADRAEGVPERLRHAVLTANQCLCDHVGAGMGQEGMGGTVIASVVCDGTLRWISVGDSSLHVFRRRRLMRLNEVHSLGPQIDMLVQQGEMDAETARRHPQRDCLTSALVGAAINRIDCPGDAFDLQQGDIVLMASDGLQVLDTSAVERVLARHRFRSSQKIAQALMQAVAFQDDPDQDNVAVVVIKPVLRRPPRVGLVFRLASVRTQMRLVLASLRQTVLAPRNGRSAP